MPLYTYNNYILTDGGYVAVTDGLCCGACCTDGDCANKNKCDCENYGGTWYGGQNCNDPDFSCESSSSCESGACCIRTLVSSPGSPGEGDYYTYECLDGRTAEQCEDYAAAENTRFLPCKECADVDCEKEWDSSSSSSSSYSSSSYSYSSYCEYGACCVRTWEEDSGGDGSGPGGAYTYECLDNRTAEECEDYASAEDTRFLPCKQCADVDCSKAWDSSSSSSSSSSSPKYKGGWVCKPVWVCEPKTDCEIDAECEPYCPPDWTPAPTYNEEGEIIPGIGGCCPPGLPFDPETRSCGGTGAVGPTTPGKCCGKQCLKPGETCCGPDADGEFVIKKEGDPGCCFKPDGAVAATKEECEAAAVEAGAAITWDPCDCPPIAGCPCSKRGEGHTLAWTADTGAENCCPPGTTVNIANPAVGGIANLVAGPDITCDCQPNDPRCQADQNGNWFMVPESAEGWQDCGEVCVLNDEECPP